MLLPKRTKYRRVHRGRRAGLSKGGTRVQFGEYGLKSLEAGWVTNRQIEAARIAMTRKIKRGGKVWITIFPDKSVTQKPAETRMGSGKGSPEGWVCVVKPGRVMFELARQRAPPAPAGVDLAEPRGSAVALEALGHDLALVDPHLDADPPKRGLGLGEAIVDVGAQRVKRHAPLAVLLRP